MVKTVYLIERGPRRCPSPWHLREETRRYGDGDDSCDLCRAKAPRYHQLMFSMTSMLYL